MESIAAETPTRSTAAAATGANDAVTAGAGTGSAPGSGFLTVASRLVGTGGGPLMVSYRRRR